MIPINLGTGNFEAVTSLCVYHDSIYFANDSYGILWRTDGTTNGSQLIASIGDGIWACYLGPMTVCGKYLFFWAYNGIQGLQLWRTDGTKSGTILLKTLIPSANLNDIPIYHNLGNKLFFWIGGIASGLYESDGTPAGTFEEFEHFENTDLNHENFGYDGQYLYFNANNDTVGNELWRTDGTTFELVQDIYPGIYSSTPSDLVVYNNQLIFAATDGVYGRELRKLDLPFNSGIDQPVEAIKADSIFVYPNPFVDHARLFLDRSITNSNYEVVIFDLYGRPVQSYKLNGNSSFDIGANLKTGVYFVHVISRGKTFTKEIIKIE